VAGGAQHRGLQTAKEIPMSKGQHGNKEAKKPKKAAVQVPLAETLVPITPATAPPRAKKR
jgi:hypothetical protein